MSCHVHWQGMGPYYREGERRFYCQSPGPYKASLCAFHREFQNEGCACDLDEARARIMADQLAQQQRNV